MVKLNCYYIKSYRVTRKVYNYIHDLTKDLPIAGGEEEQKELRKKYHKFTSHIYVNMRLKSIETDDESMNVKVPIPCDLIWEKMGREFDMKLLLKKGLMCRSGYKHNGNKGYGRCRVYWLPDEIFNQACALHTSTVMDDWNKLLKTGKGQATVNLISGSSMAKPTSKKNLYLNDTKIEKAPKLIKQSMDCLQPCTRGCPR